MASVFSSSMAFAVIGATVTVAAIFSFATPCRETLRCQADHYSQANSALVAGLAILALSGLGAAASFEQR